MMNPTENQPTNQNTPSSKRYYWLKLGTSFFHGDDVKVILSQQNGEKYVLFWLKLLLKALEQEEIGVLKYKSDVPYTPEVLATVTDTDVDTVRSALNLFHKLGMVIMDPDGSIILDAVHGMIGSVSDSAIRMRRLRERNKKQIEAPKTDQKEMSQSDVLPSQSDVELEIEKDIEKRKSREEKTEYAPNVFLTETEYQKLCDRFEKSVVDSKLEDLSCYLGNNVPVNKYKDHYLTLLRWLKKDTPEPQKPKPKKVCPECGGEVLGGVCMGCGWSKSRTVEVSA